MSYPMDQPQDERPPQEPQDAGMPFLDHLEELRRRLIKSFLAIIVMSGVAFYFADQLITLIKLPLGEVPLHNMQVTGTFYAYLKISLITGVVGALPVIFYQMWCFIAPGLYQREKAAILPLILISTILFLIGGAFCFIVVLPLALKFLIGFADELIVNYITIGSYISFAGLLLLAFGFGFQMPIVAFFLGKMGLVTPQFLAQGRRYALVIILVAAAIITPPDIFTQVLLGVPLYILYEVSIIVVRAVRPREEGPGPEA
jgi:sec-independent protein translocase protein TatC